VDENVVFISSAAMSILKCHAAKQSENIRRTEEINTVLLKLCEATRLRQGFGEATRSTEGRNAAVQFWILDF
jgi:hypothetical protein